jgi:plasmid stabilization system protein ParE
MVNHKFQVIWDDEAKASLRRIYNYIKKRESIKQAKIVRDEILDLGESLGYMPFKFAKEEYLKEVGGDIRFKSVWSYKIVYEILKEHVVILDVFHTSRDPNCIANLKRK